MDTLNYDDPVGGLNENHPVAEKRFMGKPSVLLSHVPLIRDENR